MPTPPPSSANPNDPTATSFNPEARPVHPAPARHPARIGSYAILSVIGQGGMGVVYLAEQQSPRRTVALKVIRPGIASASALRRFEHEALILGRLQHPGIAQIFEAGAALIPGSAEPQPYFAMEYIRGRPLLEHIRARNLGTRERLALFARICDAVQHAHAKGVIHRDLKPANILVDESASPPQPKILDFGIARATDLDIQAVTLQTDAGQLIGTLPYMSPEQVAAEPDDIDTRSDVYALGVILYEILTGRLPYSLDRKLVHEAVRVIREEEPTRLSQIDRIFRGDVETIVSKALDKDRARRYQSPGDLAADITRYLNDEPIVARPASAAYQFRKFARRHKAVVASAASILIVLIGAVIATGAQAAIATRERDRAVRAEALAVSRTAEVMKARDAEAALHRLAADRLVEVERAYARASTEARKAREIAAALRGMLAAADPAEARGRDITIKEALTTAAQKAADHLATQPEVQAAVLSTIGSTLRARGALAEAEPILLRALDTRRQTLGDDDPDTLTSLLELAILRQAQGRWAEAEPLFRQSFDGLRAALGDEHPDTLSAASQYAAALDTAGRLPEADALYREWLPLIRRILGPDHRDTLAAVHNFGILLYNEGKLDEAEALIREAYESQRRLLSDNHPDTVQALGDVAAVLLARGRPDDAEPLARRAAEDAQRILGPDHAKTLTALSMLAQVCMTANRLDEAERLVREVLDRQQRTLGPGHPDTLLSMNNLAVTLHLKGDIDGVIPLLRDMIAAAKTSVGEEHDFYLAACANLGHILTGRARYAEAETLLRAVYDVQRRTLGDDHPNTLLSQSNLASCLMHAGRLEEAEHLARACADGRARALGPDHPDTLMQMNNLAGILRLQGRAADSEPIIREALTRAERALPPDDPKTAQFRAALAASLTALQRFDEAEPLALAGLRGLESALGPAHDKTTKAREIAANLYDAWGKPDEAAKYRPAP